jgi:hypothetical protein
MARLMSSPHATGSRASAAKDGSFGAREELLTEALDHVLEALEFPPRQDLDAWQPPAAPRVSLAEALGAFSWRLCCSERRRYRIPRLVIIWTLLGLALFGTTWLALAKLGSQ